MFRSFILGLGAITLTILLMYGLQFGIAVTALKTPLAATVADIEVDEHPITDWQNQSKREQKTSLQPEGVSKSIIRPDSGQALNSYFSKTQDVGWAPPIVHFLGRPGYSGFPGVCRRIELELHPAQVWTEYLVVGSFVAPKPSSAGIKVDDAKYDQWTKKLQTVCALSGTSSAWFSVNTLIAQDRIAYDGARLFDAVIAAARSSVTCSPETPPV